MKKNPNSDRYKKEVGERLKYARIAAGYSQEELGELMGLTHGTIGSYERGRLSMSIQLVMVFCEALQKPLEYFARLDNAEEYRTKEKELEEKKQERFDMDESLEFTLEMSIRSYLRSKGVTEDLQEHTEKVMSYINDIVL